MLDAREFYYAIKKGLSRILRLILKNRLYGFYERKVAVKAVLWDTVGWFSCFLGLHRGL